MYLSRQIVICLPTEHLGVHKNSLKRVRAFQIQSRPRALLRMSYARIPKPVSTGVESGSRSNWKNLSEQEREPTTYSTRRRQDSNLGHIGRRRVRSHHCTILAPQQFHLSLFSISELFSTVHDQRTRRADRAEAPMIGTLFPGLGRGGATFPH